jgi:hypothetical protein
MLVTTADKKTEKARRLTYSYYTLARNHRVKYPIAIFPHILPFFSCSGNSTPNGGRFILGGGRFVLNGGRFTVAGGRFATNGGRFVPAGSRFNVAGGRFVPNGGRFTVNPPAYSPYPTKGIVYVNK